MKLAGKTLEFKTKITGKIAALVALPLGSASLLLYFALDAGHRFSSNDPSRILFVGVPLLLAFLMVATVAAILHHFLNREILLSEETLVYRDSKTELHLDITKMAFSPPNNQGLLKAMMFSDGETFVQIPEIFLGDANFAKLCEEISKRRRSSRSGHGRETYSL